MADGQLIDSVVSEGAKRDLQEIIDMLKTANKEMADVSAKSLNLKVDVTGATSLSQLLSATTQIDAAMDELAQKSATYVANIKRLAQARTEVARVNTEASRQETEASKQATEQQRKETEEAKKLNQEKLNQAKIETEIERQKAAAHVADARAKTENTRETILLAKETERLEKLAQKEAETVKKKQGEYSRLNEEYKKAAQAAKDLGAQYYRIETDIKTYKGLGFDSSAKEAQLKALAPILEQAQLEAKKLHDALYSIEIAVGQGQRKVGQYNEAARGLRDILRDMPAFAYSFGTGIEAISNNIPMLADGIGKLIQKNKEMKASGLETIPVWKQLGKELLSWQAMLAYGVAIFTIWAARSSMASTASEEVLSTVERLNLKFKEIEQTATEASGKIVGTATALIETISNVGEAESKRIDAIIELQKIMPTYLDGFSQSAILAGEAKQSIDALVESMKKQTDETIRKNKMEEVGKNLMAAQSDLDQFNKTTAAAPVGTMSGGVSTAGDVKRSRLALEKEVDFWKKKLKDLSEDTSSATNDFYQSWGKSAQPRNIPFLTKQIEFIDAQLKDATKSVETEKKLIKERKALQAELDAIYGKENGRGKSDISLLPSNNDIAKDMFKIAKTILEQEQELQKQIIDSDKSTYEQRIEARKKYYDLAVEIARAKQQEELQIAQNIMDEANKILANPKSTKDQKERANLMLEHSKLTTQLGNTGFKYDKEKAETDFQQGIQTDLNKEIQKRLQDIKAGDDKEKQVELEAYAQGLARLHDALKNKQITREQYNQKIKEQEKAFNLDMVNIEIETNEKELAELIKHGEKTIAQQNVINEKLISLRTKKAELENGTSNKPAQDPFKNDIIGAAAFNVFKGFADEDTAKDAAKDFSNFTVQLAHQTDEALRAIEDEQYNRRMRNWDMQEKRIRKSADDEIRAINATTQYQVTKANRIAAINAQTASAESEIEAKKKRENIRHFEAQQMASRGEIIMNTGVAIANIWKHYSHDPIIAGVLTAMVTGIGVAQMAKVNSAVPPAYKHGTKATPRSEFAYVGDGGEREWIQEPGRAGYWSGDKTELRFLPKGTSVTPLSQLVKVAQNHAGQYQFSYNNATNSATLREVGRGIESAIDKQTNAMAWMLGQRQNITVQVDSHAQMVNKYL